MLVDAHCHLTGSYLTPDQLEPTLARARAEGVTGFIAVGTDLEDSRLVLELARTVSGVRASLGCIPHEAKTWSPEVAAGLAQLLEDPAVRFVGETGLDWHYDLSPRAEQEVAFRAQIRLAKRLGKPLMIHTRSAPEATLRVLEEEGADDVRGIIHCFSEDRAFAARALDLGFYLSFSGIATFKKAEAVREVAAWAPADRILVETDAPFLAPVPYRGKPNEPGFVRFTAEAVAALRGIPSAKLAELTTRNLEALCGWAPSLLIVATLVAPSLWAQAHPLLPWEQVLPLPWQPSPLSGDAAGPTPVAPSSGSLSLAISEDGTVRVVDGRGLVRLEEGLPGRPLRAWRDGGIPLATAVGTWRFPAETPLLHGLGALGWCAADFRPYLQGLCWVMEDGEGYLAVIHPATGRIIYLPLPPGRDLSLRFLPDRLEVVAGRSDAGAPSRWSLPWMGLLPRLAALGPRPEPARRGTALVPFPHD